MTVLRWFLLLPGMAAALGVAYLVTGILLMMPGPPSSLNLGAGENGLVLRKVAYLFIASAIQPAAMAWAFVYAAKGIAPRGKRAVATLAVATYVLASIFLLPGLIGSESGAGAVPLVAVLFYLAGGLLGAATPLEKPASDPPLA